MNATQHLTNTGGWVTHSVNLSAYAGQTVALQIRVETDSSLNSNLFVDDVAMMASPLAEMPGQAQIDPQQTAPKSNTLVKQPVQ